MANILVYELEGKIYINLTNRCTNDCIFCLRKDKSNLFIDPNLVNLFNNIVEYSF